MSVIIGMERLPTLEILGKEWAYNIFDSSRAKDLIRIVKNLKATKDSTLLRDIKSFIAEVFIEGVALVQAIEAIYKDNSVLWTDAFVQIITEIKNPKIMALQAGIDKLEG